MTPATGTGSAPAFDATLTAEALGGEGGVREAARLRLRIFLIAVAWFELERRREQLAALSSAEAARVARDSADAAYAAVLARLGDYRGQSRFAVWVAKFAIHEAAAAARQRAGRRKAEAAGDTNPPASSAGGTT